MGRVPKAAPTVTWSVASIEKATMGSVEAVAKKLIGHLHNSEHPAITVDIQMTDA